MALARFGRGEGSQAKLHLNPTREDEVVAGFDLTQDLDSRVTILVIEEAWSPCREAFARTLSSSSRPIAPR
jgi:hypothetical protein